MFAGFVEKMWALCCNAGHAVMKSIVYQLFLVLCRPNELNFTQLIAVTFTTVRPQPRFRSREAKSHKGAHFLNTILNVCSNPHKKSRLRHVNFINNYLDPESYKIWTPNRPSTVICSFATWAREETRNSIFCKSLKLLSPCRLFSRFTFAPACSLMSHKLQQFPTFLWQCIPSPFRHMSRTVARRFSIGGFAVLRGGFSFVRGGLDIINLTKTPLIYSVSRFNLGGHGALFGGVKPTSMYP